MIKKVHITDTVVTQDFNNNIIFSNKYLLNILIEQSSISYAIEDMEQKKVVAVKSDKLDFNNYFRSIKSFILDDAYLQKKFKKIVIGFNTPITTIIPNDLYDDKLNDEYLRFNYAADKLRAKEILTGKIKNLQATVIFALDKEVKMFLSKKFPSAVLTSGIALWISLLLKEHDDAFSPRVFINVNKDDFYIVAIKKDQLIYFNRFEYKNEDECLYYLLNAYKQLRFSTTLTHTYLAGSISEKDKLYTMLSSYFAKLSFLDFPKEFSASEKINKTIAHPFSNLYALSLCES